MTDNTLDTLFLPYGDVVLKERLLQFLSNINQQLQSDHLFVARIHVELQISEVIAHLHHGEPGENFEYSLKGTPCENVAGSRVCTIAKDVCRSFPEDQLLEDMSIEGYLGVPLRNAQGQAIGILVSLYKKPIENLDSHRILFQTFATLIVAEIHNLIKDEQLKSQMDLLNEVGEIAKAGGWQYDLVRKELTWTAEVYRIYGLPQDLPVTPDIGIRHYSEEARQTIESYFLQAAKDGREYCLELPLTDANGCNKWVRTSGKAVRNEHGRIIKVFGAFEDITEEKALLLSAHEQTHYITAILDNLNDAVVAVDVDGKIAQANKVACNMFGYDAEQWPDMSVSSLMPQPYASYHQQYMNKYLETGEAAIIGVGRQLPAVRKNGEIFQMELSLSETYIRGKQIFIGVIRDISEKLDAQDTIYRLAYNDQITGLPNKKWFEQEVTDLLVRARLQERFLYCCLIDIDNLCHINLRYNKSAGDQVIKSVADQLSLLAVGQFKLYQSGADSFYLLCTEPMNQSELSPFKHDHIETLLDKYAQTLYCINDNEIKVSYSRGSAVLASHDTHFESLVGLLEFAKHEAKKAGTAGVYFVDNKSKGEYERTTTLRQELKTALERDEFYLQMQPQYDGEQQMVGAEALIRWQNAKLGRVGPDEFIPIAEQSDLILEIGDWVIAQVCQYIHQLKSQLSEPAVVVSINVSARQIANSDFKYKLVGHLQKWQINPDEIMLELTETTLVSNIALVKQVMEELQSLGFRFSIDDFGTGYSSLAYLKTLPISELKIDKCFVNDVVPPYKPADVSIVNMIIDMSRALNVKTVAEGVENQEQMAFLKDRGCDIFQGYYLSKPINVGQWQKLYLKND